MAQHHHLIPGFQGMKPGIHSLLIKNLIYHELLIIISESIRKEISIAFCMLHKNVNPYKRPAVYTCWSLNSL